MKLWLHVLTVTLQIKHFVKNSKSESKQTMTKHYNAIRELAEGILYAFTLPERKVYLDEENEDHEVISKDESNKRILSCCLCFNVCLQFTVIETLALILAFFGKSGLPNGYNGKSKDVMYIN